VTDRITWMKKRLENLYARNPYLGLLQIKIDDISEGEARLAMTIVPEKHNNIFGIAHGGALASLADTAMGVVCATLGRRVVTLEMNINYIASAVAGQTVYGIAQAIHNGQTTIVVEARLEDDDGRLLAKTRGTFFVVGQLDFGED